MGYRGKVEARERARELRARGWPLADIAAEVGTSKGTVSVWVPDVAFVRRPRAKARRREPNVLQRRKAAEIEQLLAEGRARIGCLSERDLLVAGAALYAGEGAKRDGDVHFANSDARMIRVFVSWLRHFFDIDESRLRVRLYLHEGLDVDAAIRHWSAVTGVPPSQFNKPYRAAADPSLRSNKHEFGCVGVVYRSASTHRAVMGLVSALLSCEAIPG